MSDIRNHFLSLVEKATAAAEAYANTDELLLSDEEYDLILEEIEVLSEEYGWNEGDSLLNEIADGSSEGGDVTHVTPMLSLAKSHTEETLKAFLVTVKGKVVAEPKFDGMAVSATYVNGKLVLAATRGNGTTGEDVTQRSIGIQGLPATIPYTEDLEVRGEVFITAESFHEANLARLAFNYSEWAARNPKTKKVTIESLYAVAKENRILPEGDRKVLKGEKTSFSPEKFIFANERNAVAGTLRKEDRDYHTVMNFACYDVLGGDDLGATYSDRLAYVEKNFGVTSSTSYFPEEVKALTDPIEILNKFGEIRVAKELTFPTDGMVFKADSFAERNRLGTGSKYPKWAVAYKYPSIPLETVLLDIVPTIGRTGRMALKGRLKPVLVDGTLIEFVSLHNVPHLMEKDLRIGDTVLIRRAGDVIPQIDTFVASKRPEGAKRWVAPAVCWQCGGDWDKSNKLWRCVSLECGELNSIIFAAGRDYFDWEGLSEAHITRLNETGKVSDIADVFALTLDELINLDTGRVYADKTKKNYGEPILLGEKTATKIFEKIQASKKRPFAAVLAALGIRSLGRSFGRRLSAKYGDMGNLWKASVTELANVEGIANTKAKLIYDGLREREELILRLNKLGVNMSAPKKVAVSSSSMVAGKKIVVSGSVPGFTRTGIQDKIAELGGTPSSSVSSTTDYLVADSSMEDSSKYKKALSLGVKIIDPAVFATML